MSRQTLAARVRAANASPPPDHSIVFRVSTGIAVLVGIYACQLTGELSAPTAWAAIAGVSLGMVFSYATRNRPWQWVKIALAVAVVAIFARFVTSILAAAHTGELASVETPLAGLFTWVQVVHAFDVPARRDLLFSLAAAAALVTIAGAQAVSSNFVILVAIWIVATLVALACSWRSMTGGRGALPLPLLTACLVIILAVSLALLLVLPQPRASQALTLPASLTRDLPLSGTGIVKGVGSDPEEPAKAGLPGGKIGVGGYLGFDEPLETADRLALGNQVVMRVRANRPGYFLGETYDTWTGESWLQSRFDRKTTVIRGGSPFTLAPSLAGGDATTNVQTFYVAQPLPNLLFATSNPAEVYFPDGSIVLGNDGSIRSTVAITPGTVYTVVSADDEVPAARLAADRETLPARPAGSPEIRLSLQLPHPYPRVARLARLIVARARARTTYAKVLALEGWMARNTEYTTAIPPLKRGQDTVTEFLFGNRKGYCEQISTSLAVMLRTLGIPAREAIGYVPGPFDPLSDLYEIQAKDAHAWVQVYFPGYGWQSFDPTADVPLAPANPGVVLLGELGSDLAHLPWLPVGSVAGAGVAGTGLVSFERRRRRRPATWAGLMAWRLERLGVRTGLRRGEPETLLEYAARLERARPGLGVLDAARILEESAYGRSPEPSARAVSRVEAAVARLRRETGRLGLFSRGRSEPRRRWLRGGKEGAGA